jgi:hypothetical protein
MNTRAARMSNNSGTLGRREPWRLPDESPIRPLRWGGQSGFRLV